jgi:Rrf2 family cysteine metabolism transcriptional repressor
VRVTAREQYGLRAMVELAHHYGGQAVSLTQVAEAQGVALASLEQIMADLRHAGLLESKRGMYGGYRLTRPPSQITAGDVFRAMEGSIVPVQCVTDADCDPCAREQVCATRTVWEQVHNRLVDTLDGITLAELCEDTEASPAPVSHSPGADKDVKEASARS